MKKFIPLLALLMLMAACQNDSPLDSEAILSGANNNNGNGNNADGVFAVTNRGSGTVSIIDASDQSIIEEIVLPQAGASPTYVVHSAEQGHLFVSDFSSEKVWVYDGETFDLVDSYDAGVGGFHMWVNDKADQIWVNNIVDKTTSVLSSETGEELASLALEAPGIVFEDDAAQHDVVIAPNGKYAYVSVFSQTGQNYVIQYNTDDFEIENVAEVGGDPHLSVNQSNLYILSQDDSTITEYQFNKLKPTNKMATIDNAHGITPRANRGFFVTNISGREVVNYDARQSNVVSTVGAQATAGVAHNVAYSAADDVVALTISGGSSTEFFSVSDGELSQLSSLETGGNPFGIWYYEIDN